MKELNIKRNLSDNTRIQGVWVMGKTYSMHITKDNEVIITDLCDYSKIYSIQSLDFFNLLERADIAELAGKEFRTSETKETINTIGQGEAKS